MNKQQAQAALNELLMRTSNMFNLARELKSQGKCDSVNSQLALANGALLGDWQKLVSDVAASKNQINDNSIGIEVNRQFKEYREIKLPAVQKLYTDCIATASTTQPGATGPTASTGATGATSSQTSGPPANNTTSGVQVARNEAFATPSARDSWVEAQTGDWRVRLSLAPEAGPILYRAPYQELQSSILAPLSQTDGVIFPYTPSINTTYTAAYEPTILTHSNYKAYNYTGSYIEAVNITCDFTAQDTFEANYLLATIHFFRSVTKMFYGQDQNVKPGTPPPLCFLNGLGEFQFNMHPLVISSFTYNLPNNVNYIRATTVMSAPPGGNRAAAQARAGGYDAQTSRTQSTGQNITTGGVRYPTIWPNNLQGRADISPTYVPTAMQVVITAYPVISRNKVSNEFSLQDYSTGKLLQGSRIGGAFW